LFLFISFHIQYQKII